PTSRPVGPVESQSVADAAGRFRIDELSEATYLVQVSAPGKGSLTVPGVKVEAGRATDLGPLRLSPTTTVRGSVVDGRGAPIAGAVVSAQPAGTLAVGVPLGEVMTDAAG